MSNQEEIELFRKYLKKELSQSELVKFTDIFCAEIREENFDAAIKMEMEFLTSKANPNAEAALKVYSLLLQHIHAKNRLRGGIRFNKKTIAGVFAILILLSVAGLFFPFQNFREAGKQEVVQTPASEKKYMRLADKSEVWLNKATSIHWNKSEFNKKYREVYLDGQAFFKIKKNSKRPFIVCLSDFNIKVVGTSFDVKSYSAETEIVVSLKTGKIMIDGVGMNNLSLKEGQQLKFNKITKIGEIREIDSADFIAWRSGQFQYETAELRLIAKAIEEWFDVEITIADQDMWNYRLTVNQSDSSLKEILDAIAYVTGMNYSQHGKKIVFYHR